MTLQEIQNLAHAEYGNRYQITPAQFLRYYNIVQAMAFDQDLEAFKDYSNTLTILTQLNVSAFSAAPVAGDVTRTVVGTTSGHTGTLRYYENGTRKILAVELTDPDEDFQDGEAFTITGGTGAGTLESSDSVETYKGPYDLPSSPLCRKLLGVTKRTDAQLFGVEVTTTGDDYGMATSPSLEKIWERGRVSYRGTTRTFTFIEIPEIDTENAVYRWVYFVRPPVIASVSDDANFWIPLEHHWLTFYQAVIALADNATYGEKQPAELLKPYLDPFWESMRQQNTPMGGIYDYGISEGTPL